MECLVCWYQHLILRKDDPICFNGTRFKNMKEYHEEKGQDLGGFSEIVDLSYKKAEFNSTGAVFQ